MHHLPDKARANHLNPGLVTHAGLIHGRCQDLLTLEHVCKFSRWARAYICTYYLLAQQEEQNRQAAAAAAAQALSMTRSTRRINRRCLLTLNDSKRSSKHTIVLQTLTVGSSMLL